MSNLEMQGKPGSSSGGSSTQAFLMVSEIRDGAIVKKDGGLRAVIAVSSTNFVLKSKDEQEAILSRYQGFLNNLDFPIQILMQSRPMDIHGYLDKIRVLEMEQRNELLRMQTEEYVEYVSKLLEFGNIMNKTFYVILPFQSGEAVDKEGFFSRLKKFSAPANEIIASKKKFLEDLAHLNERADRVQSELTSLNLQTMRLNSEELVELLFNSYNPGYKVRDGINTSELDIIK